MTSNVVSLLLDSGERPLFTRRRRVELGRCVRCEWHPETQGHHPYCPDADDCSCPPADTDKPNAAPAAEKERAPLTGTDEVPDWVARLRWRLAHPTPRPPAFCWTCGIRLTPERAGRNLRCESCWDELLAAQPRLRGESAT